MTAATKNPLHLVRDRCPAAAALWLVAAALMAAPRPAAAATLDWETVQALGLAHNVGLAAAKSAEERAQHLARAADKLFVPVLDAETKAVATKVVDAPEPKIFGRNPNHETVFVVTENLFAGGRDAAERKRAQVQRDAAALGTEAARLKLVLTLRQTFNDALYFQQLLDQHRQTQTRRAQNVTIVTLRVEGGREHKGSLLRSQAAAAQADADLDQAERALDLTRQKLAYLTGTAFAPDTSFAGDLFDGGTELPPAPAVTTSIAYRQAAADVAVAEASLQAERRLYAPNVTAKAFLKRRGVGTFGDKPEYGVELALSVPLFDGGRLSAYGEAAATTVNGAALNLRDTAAATTLREATARTALNDALARLRVQGEFVKASELQSKIMREQYTLGLISFQDWDGSENDLINNQKAAMASRRDAAQARAAWEQTVALGQ